VGGESAEIKPFELLLPRSVAATIEPYVGIEIEAPERAASIPLQIDVQPVGVLEPAHVLNGLKGQVFIVDAQNRTVGFRLNFCHQSLGRASERTAAIAELVGSDERQLC
jgi:hypothetical protein